MAFDSTDTGYFPGTIEDKELSALRAEIMALPDLVQNSASCVNRAMGYALDGAYSFEELEGVEKSVMGLKIEKYWLKTFGFQMKMTSAKIARLLKEDPSRTIENTLLDTEIAGIPVDVKHTIGDNWMVPPEAVGHWLLLFRTDIINHRFSVGLFKADIDKLTIGTNQDKKRNIRAWAKKNIDWLIVAQPFGE